MTRIPPCTRAPAWTRAVLRLALAGAAMTPGTLAAQGVANLRLRAAAPDLEDGFTQIGSVRELGDGRVLVTDFSENRLAVVDWTSGSIRTVGTEGKGPGEYTAIGMLHALPGDSTLAEDPGAGRWLLLHGSRIVSTFPYSQRRGRPLPTIWGADGAGHILSVRHYSFGRSPGVVTPAIPVFAESLVVMREHRTTGKLDTLVRLSGAFLGVREVRRPVVPGGSPVSWTLSSPLASEDQAVLFPDGWIAVVRKQRYRVDWREPNGRWRTSPRLPFVATPVDEAQKRAAMARKYRPGSGITADDVPQWPAHLPPFLVRAVLPTADGRVAILRTTDARRRGNLYDIVNRDGRLSARLTLAENERVVGFGRNAVFVVTKDEDDVAWLRRHPWP